MSHAYSVPHVCPSAQRGATVWLTGLPSAGKSTIAHGCEAVLRGECVIIRREFGRFGAE